MAETKSDIRTRKVRMYFSVKKNVDGFIFFPLKSEICIIWRCFIYGLERINFCN